MLCGDRDGWGGGVVGGRPKREGIYVHIHVADSLRCTAETNTTL